MYTSEHLVLELLHYQLFCSFVNTCMDIGLHSLKIITLSIKFLLFYIHTNAWKLTAVCNVGVRQDK